MSPAPSVPLTYELLHERADSLIRHAPQVHPTIDRLELLRIFVRGWLSFPNDCRDMVADSLRQAFDKLRVLNPGTAFDASPLLEGRKLIEQLLDSTALCIETTLNLVATPPIQTTFAEDARLLREALAEMHRIREEFSENFPLLDEQGLTSARADVLTGEGLELDDAFAALAGCSKEDWLTRAQTHQKARQQA